MFDICHLIVASLDPKKTACRRFDFTDFELEQFTAKPSKDVVFSVHANLAQGKDILNGEAAT